MYTKAKPHPGRVSYSRPRIQASILFEQSQPPQIFVQPASVLDHGTKRADRKRVAQTVVGHDDSAAVGVAVDSMTSTHAPKGQPLGLPPSGQLTSRHPRG